MIIRNGQERYETERCKQKGRHITWGQTGTGTDGDMVFEERYAADGVCTVGHESFSFRGSWSSELQTPMGEDIPASMFIWDITWSASGGVPSHISSAVFLA